MRAMVPQQPNPPVVESPRPSRPRRFIRLRPWVQAAFLPVWMAPVAALRGVPSCVLHCYACPLASASCPIGLAASAAALHLVPLLTIGVILLVGSLVGSLVCGWVCPFGFVQDLFSRIPTPKFRLPAWTGLGRYLVLIGLVIVGPALFGKSTSNWAFICNLCPVGAAEAGLPRMISGQVPWSKLLNVKYVILAALVVAMLFTHRPWCRMLCPLGGVLALFNRFSVFHLRFDPSRCRVCNTCRSRCDMGVAVEREVNTAGCVRCLACTACGALEPAVGRGMASGTPSVKQ
ncbi:MAG: 4Fe-4S binding protein [Planctomycetes bacterium]|nr:4Fe-4S binding protein [Planctomycetota bacterium]